MHYLNSSKKDGITYRSNIKEQLDLYVYTNTNFARRALLDSKSTLGYIFFLASRLISWQSKRQLVVVVSMLESKYIEQAYTIKHAIYFY